MKQKWSGWKMKRFQNIFGYFGGKNGRKHFMPHGIVGKQCCPLCKHGWHWTISRFKNDQSRVNKYTRMFSRVIESIAGRKPTACLPSVQTNTQNQPNKYMINDGNQSTGNFCLFICFWFSSDHQWMGSHKDNLQLIENRYPTGYTDNV